MTQMQVDRSKLEFDVSVDKSFAFLRDVGFIKVYSCPTLVTYSRDDISIDIYHGRLSYEISSCINRGDKTYYLSQFILISDIDNYNKYRNYMASTRETVSKGVSILADMFLKYVFDKIDGDCSVYKEIDRVSSILLNEYADKTLYLSRIESANNAFREKRYEDAYSIYTEISKLLKGSEIKKFEYCKKNLDKIHNDK